MTVDLATERDASELTALAERTFRDTYSPNCAPADVDAYVRDHFSAERQRAEIADGAMRTLVVRHEGAMIAYAQLREGPIPAPVIGRAIEVARFYVSREWHGRGIADELMAATLGGGRAMGGELAWLGVWERNTRAIAFYRRHQFAEVGMQTFTMGSDVQHDLVMATRL